jgi:hypothetical protein
MRNLTTSELEITRREILKARKNIGAIAKEDLDLTARILALKDEDEVLVVGIIPERSEEQKEVVESRGTKYFSKYEIGLYVAFRVPIDRERWGPKSLSGYLTDLGLPTGYQVTPWGNALRIAKGNVGIFLYGTTDHRPSAREDPEMPFPSIR